MQIVRLDYGLLPEMVSFMDAIRMDPESDKNFHPYGSLADLDEVLGAVDGLLSRIRKSEDPYFLGFKWDKPAVAIAHGFLRGWNEGKPSAEIGLAVHPAEQGKGWGRKMLQYLIATACQHGDSETWLTVFKTNTRAIRLYESLGFVLSECEGKPDRWKGILTLT